MNIDFGSSVTTFLSFKSIEIGPEYPYRNTKKPAAPKGTTGLVHIE